MVPFTDQLEEPAVRGFIHHPLQEKDTGDSLVLTHGAGANCQSKLLISVASAFDEAGVTVLRCDLPFRQERPHGPPFPGKAARDRNGLRRAVMLMRERTKGKVFLGGHSYGGRQASVLLSEGPQLADGLVLLSYPLHPPRKPAELRVGHFPALKTPLLFVHGARDPFGSIAEMKSSLEQIPAPKFLLEVEGTGHELLPRKSESDLPERIVAAWKKFFLTSTAIAY
ncbi:MAG TPA: alpha/beta family hydrolase [Candidatus Angelobacter sp.]|nr:alpha/beta family hydrolase [Candidatus Angelobacter sp.]